jgi:transposase-like protein
MASQVLPRFWRGLLLRENSTLHTTYYSKLCENIAIATFSLQTLSKTLYRSLVRSGGDLKSMPLYKFGNQAIKYYFCIMKITITLYCPACQSANIFILSVAEVKKNGKKSSKKQNYFCKDCGRQFIGDHALTYKGSHSSLIYLC